MNLSTNFMVVLSINTKKLISQLLQLFKEYSAMKTRYETTKYLHQVINYGFNNLIFISLTFLDLKMD